MPTYGGPTVNAIVNDEEMDVISDVCRLTFPLLSVKQHLINSGIFPGCGVDCMNCKSQLEGCDELKYMVQWLIDEGPIQFYWRLKNKKVVNDEVAVIFISYESVVPINIQVPI